MATADRIYDDEDDDYTDSQFGSQQPLTQLQQFKHLQVSRITPEFVQEQSLNDEYAYAAPAHSGSSNRRSQLGRIPERPSKPKKNESRMQKQTENTKSTYLDDIKVDAREITESVSQHEIVNNTAPGQMRERRAADQGDERLQHSGLGQMALQSQRPEQRTQINYSVPEIEETRVA